MARAPGLRPQTSWEDGSPRLPKACGDERSAGPTGAAATAPLCRRGKPPPFKPRETAANTKHACCHPNSADPAYVSCSVPQASSSRERVWSPAGARGAGRTAVTREKSSLVRMQLAAEGKARAPPAAPDEWASSGSSCSYFPAVEGLLSEHTCAAIMPCCEYSTPPPGPVLPTQHRERTESSGGGPDSGGAAEAPLHPSISCSRHLNLLGALAPRPSWPPYRRQS